MKKLSLFALLAGILLMTVSCSGSDDPQPGSVSSEMILSPQVITNDYRGGKNIMQITTDESWKAQSPVDWLEVTPSEGTGTTKVTVSCQKNTTLRDRSAMIRFTAGLKTKDLSFHQTHKADTARVVSSRVIIGNRAAGEHDSIEIVFNTPATLRTNWMTDENGEGISTQSVAKYDMDSCRYRLAIGTIGWNINCDLEIVSNTDKIVTKDRLNFTYYDHRNILVNAEEGESVSYSVLSPDKKSIWVSVIGDKWKKGRNRIVQLSADDLKEIKSVDMPWGPRYLSFNPYNGKLYVLPYSGSPVIVSAAQLCVVDPDAGRIVKTVDIETSPLAHPQQPTDFPDEVEFTSDGLGVLRLRSSDDNACEWRWIDSADDDRITLSGYEWHEVNFDHIYHNFDYSRIYTTDRYTQYIDTRYVNRQHRTPVLLQIANKFNSDKYYAGGKVMDLQMSPRANKYFVCTAPGSQCVVSLDPIGYSEVCEEEARGSKCAWDELVTDRDYVWQVCPLDANQLQYYGWLQLFDMTSGKPIFATIHSFNDVYHNPVIKCHHLPASDKLLVVGTKGVWMLDAKEMKRKAKG